MVVLTLLIFIGFRVVRNRFVTGRMTPEEKKRMERFFNEPVEIPAEWQEVEPFSPELLRAAKGLAKEWTELQENEGLEHLDPLMQRLFEGNTLEHDEWEIVRTVLSDFETLFSEAEAFVKLPDYVLAAFPSVNDDTPAPLACPNFLFAQQLSKMFVLRAFERANHGQFSEAFDTAFFPIQLCKRHVASSLITHLIAVSIESIACEGIYQLSVYCEDERILQEALEELKTFSPIIHVNSLQNAHLLDIVSSLRAFARADHDVDLSSREPPVYFFKQWISLMSETDSRGDPVLSKAVLNVPILSRILLEILYSVAVPNVATATVRDSCSRAKFGLTQLETACRIEHIRTGHRPDNPSRLSLSYFPEQIQDPFSDRPYPWSEGRTTFYSVGPDHHDDLAEISYDPTNGTVSSGDVFFVPSS